jgi:3-phenylpropionate/cinnamic acid dioxygenase small subunit
MNVEPKSSPSLDLDVRLQFEIEQFYYYEAELLDSHQYDAWLSLFTGDTRYRMPSRANRLMRDRGKENSKEGEVSLFDDDRTTLGWRVKQLSQLTHWAENPRSRTRHLVSNVRVVPSAVENEFRVRSNFLCYRNRLQDEVDIWAGERQDLLRGGGGRGFLIAERTVLLDQNVVLSKNLSVFF